MPNCNHRPLDARRTNFSILKRYEWMCLVAGLAIPWMGVSPAGATVKAGAINCTATTLLGPVALRNPSITHVTGPVWATTSAAITITTKAGKTVLPRTAGAATIGSYQDLVNKAQLVGSATTTVTTGAVPGLVFTYDPDLADNGGVPNPVPMNGVATYAHAFDGVLGPFPAPTVTVTGPLPLVGVAGTFDVTTVLDPGVGTLPVGSTPGNPGGTIFSPDVPISITNSGTTNTQIQMIGTSTTLTANVIAPLVTTAVTSCAPSAEPTHVVNVQTDGAAITPTHPVIACDPTNGTSGLFKDAKGWWSMDTNIATVENYGGTLSGTTTYDGCIAPDVRLEDWVGSKNGALAADSVALAKASISIKAKGFGNCSQVDRLGTAGLSHGADSSTAYERSGTLSTKWLTAASVASKVKGSTASVAVRLVVDTTGVSGTVTRLEANGIVTKGTGVGGKVKFVGEVDPATALNIVNCNTPGYVPPAVGLFFANQAPYLLLNTGDDAVLEVSAP